MISTARGLVLLAAVAVAMVATLFIDLHRAEPARDHTLVSGFDEARVVKLTWSAPTAPAYLAIERGTPHAPWRRTLPSAGEVDQGAVGDILAALRGGRWQRVGNAAQAGEGQVTLTIEMRTDTGVERIDLGLGAGSRMKQPVPDAQEWIARGDRAYLVDAWVARALQPDALALAVTHPLAPAANAPTITFWNQAGDVTVSGDGTENRIVQLGAKPTITDHGVRLDPAVAHELERALANIEIVALSTVHTATAAQTATPIAHTDNLQIEWAGTRADLATTGCNGNATLVELIAPSGGGCVHAADATALRDVLAKLRGPATEIAAKSPVPFPVGVVQFGDGQELDVTKRPRIGQRTQAGGLGSADSTKAQALLAALAAPAAVFAPQPGTNIDGRKLFIRGDHGAEETLVLGERPIVWRAAERVALRVSPAAYDAIAREAKDYVDLQLWAEEPTTIVKVSINDREYTRGAVVGEWSSATDAKSIDALVALLAAPDADAPFTAKAPAKSIHIVLAVQPPVGTAFERALDLSTSGSTCVATVQRVLYAVNPTLCAAASAAK